VLHPLTHFCTREGEGEDEEAGAMADDQDTQRRWAIDLFNRVWALLDQPDRTPDDDAAMVHAAHTSAFHWSQVGEPVNLVRGEWQCSRVYAVLGRPEPALFHARRALALCEQHGIGDFDLAFAYEALARANGVAGEDGEARRWVAQAKAASADIAEDDDRQLVLADLETVPLA
jgi:hypothetical protein